jgi:ribosome-associated toxin RatA of RatAB toxin-antitoxin module
MKTLNKSVLIWHSAQQMFDLVVDIDRYAEFLPWCSHSRVLHREGDALSAEIGLSFAGFSQSFTTNNQHRRLPDGALAMSMALERGPFSTLEGEWVFLPIADSQQTNAHACRIQLSLNYAFSSNALGFLIGPAFDRVAAGLVDAFVGRAEKIYAQA